MIRPPKKASLRELAIAYIPVLTAAREPKSRERLATALGNIARIFDERGRPDMARLIRAGEIESALEALRAIT